jgi:hypothetical protein
VASLRNLENEAKLRTIPLDHEPVRRPSSVIRSQM